MRVLYFTRDYTPHDHRFLAALSQSPHQVYSLRLERRGRALESRPLPPGIEAVSWRGGQAALRWWQAAGLLQDLRRVIRAIQPDVIHAGPIQSAAFFAALSGFHPLVSMSWGSDLLLDTVRSGWSRWQARFTLQRSDILLGDCLAVQRRAEALGFPPGRVVLFPWGVDLAHFRPLTSSSLRSELDWDGKNRNLRQNSSAQEAPFVLLSNRTWEPLYGVDVLVRAFCRAASQAPALRLLLLGGGSQGPRLRAILAEHNLLNRVHFGGQVGYDQLPEYYNAADLYLSASHSDGSSVSLMEALACGKPVLVSDIPGNLEWITPGEQGWLFPDGDEEALARGILNAVQMRASLPRLGQAARALAERRADWKVNSTRMLEAYALAVNLARSPRR